MTQIHTSDRVFVAGHNGLVGSALVELLQTKGYKNIITRTRRELDLLDGDAVQRFYSETKPDVVFVAAAKVGGIHANNVYRADFIHQNLQIQDHLIWGAHVAGVRRLIFLGSSCIYPKLAPQPMPETCLLTGELEPTNRPYAVAKIAGLELVSSLRKQYGRDYFSVMPTNLYGPRDNFHSENSHVLPALLNRFVEAKARRAREVNIWGSGNPRREFLYSLDCADAIIYLAETLKPDFFESPQYPAQGYSHINVGTGTDVTIKSLAQMIAAAVGHDGHLVFDASKPDGTPRKLLDVSVLQKLGWRAQTTLEAGLAKTLAWFTENATVRR